MRERPILFSAPMVRAILAGSKTQTRRVVKPDLHLAIDAGLDWTVRFARPYGQPGDRLWVRETLWLPRPVTAHDLREGADTWPKCVYSADTDATEIQWMREHRWKQRPSIHMPRWASRITLEITGVRVERLQAITESDAQAEGSAPSWLDADDNDTVHAQRMPTYRQGFARIWHDINGTDSWNANPWVWVVEFKRVTP